MANPKKVRANNPIIDEGKIIIPGEGKVFCKLLPQGEIKVGAIIMPESNTLPRGRKAEVLALSPDCENKLVRVGDIVITQKFMGTETTYGNEDCVFIKYDMIEGIIRDVEAEEIFSTNGA